MGCAHHCGCRSGNTAQVLQYRCDGLGLRGPAENDVFLGDTHALGSIFMTCRHLPQAFKGRRSRIIYQRVSAVAIFINPWIRLF